MTVTTINSGQVLSRSCKQCNRTFSKPEHLRRHERSHTGERPFQCSICERRYARRDVLTRHLRGHYSHKGLEDNELPHIVTATTARRSNSVSSSSSNSKPPFEAGEVSIQFPGLSRKSNDTIQAHSHRAKPADRARSKVPPVRRLDEQEIDNLDSEPYRQEPLAHTESGQDIQEISESMESVDAATLQDLSILPASFDFLAQMTHLDLEVLGDSFLFQCPLIHQQPSKQNVAGISDERLQLIETLWPAPMKAEATAPSPVCWNDIVLHPADNLFSSPSIGNVNVEESPSEELDSAWQFTQACRDRLAHHCHSYMKERNKSRSISHDSSPDFFRIGNQHGTDALPPADVLDLCLDLYFNHFHSSYPIIHPPTFNASQTPTILLFPMCLIGLIVMNRKAAYTWAQKSLPGAIESCCSELLSANLDCCAAPELMIILTAACLLCLVASILGNIVSNTQSAKLQSCHDIRELITALKSNVKSRDLLLRLQLHQQLASRRKLFEEPKVSPSCLLGQQSTKEIWRAWTRINSGKRLVAALIIVDAHSAQAMQLLPQCPHTVHIPGLSGDDIFDTYDFEEWSASSESIEMSLGGANCNLSQSGFGLQATLASIWIELLHERHRLLESLGLMDNPLRQPLSNHELFSKDTQAKSISNRFIALYGQHASDFVSGNTNSAILWNFLGLHLCCNLSVIELAAGRNGPATAREATDSLSTWATTPIARRACLHAAQILLVFSRQQRGDGIPLHAEFALFNAALVLGVYVASMPEQGDVEARSYDLLKEINWNQIGGKGFLIEEQTFLVHPAGDFIQDGGPISFSGTKFRSSSGMARRIFMNFSARMEEIGKWNSQKYCTVLQVMADTMLELRE